jgi:hypothetical protein
MPPVAVAGDVVAARMDGGAKLHADTSEVLAIPMQAPARAERIAVAMRELNIFPRKDHLDNRIGLQSSTLSKRPGPN